MFQRGGHPCQTCGTPAESRWRAQGGSLEHRARLTASRSATGAPSVDAFHVAALTADAADRNAPRLHPEYHPGYYGAFVTDPDGYNLEAVVHEW